MSKQHTKCGKSDTQIRKNIEEILNEDYKEYISVYDAKQVILAIRCVINTNTLNRALNILVKSYTYDSSVFNRAFCEKYVNIIRSELHENQD